MLLLGKLGVLIALIRASVQFSHPLSYALIWAFLSLLGAMLGSPSFLVLFLSAGLSFIVAAGYFYFLDYLEGSVWWWLLMAAGAYLLLII